MDATTEPATVARHAFYVMRETSCPYLEGRRERKLLTDLNHPAASALYGRLSRAGFRRSHDIAYRPACSDCTACVPVRIKAQAFVANASFRRILRANRHLSRAENPPQATEEQYHLFRRYIASRHWDGEMAAMTGSDYRAMLEDTHLDTRVTEYRDPDGRLVAACIADWLEDGLSAVYSFFEPDLSRHSLGSYMILAMIEQAQAAGLSHVYLGYWIAASRKMNYKARFRPIEGLGPQGWRELEA